MIYLAQDTIDNYDIDRLIAWLGTYPRLTKGQLTLDFEQQWSNWLGRKYSLFVNSGSSANLLMIYALICGGFLKNKKVVVPGLCWATDLAPIIQFGLDPILCDVNLDNLSVDLKELEQIFIKESPAALLLVSILGLVPKMDAIQDLCNKYNVILLEDTCESLGSLYNNQRLGTFGLMSSFSFYFGHHISTIEGGMISTDSIEIYNILTSVRSHGWDRDMREDQRNHFREIHNISEFNASFTFYYPGFNLRATDLQAFIGIGQLQKLNTISYSRFNNFNKYQEKLNNHYWKPKSSEYNFISNFGYPIIHPSRDLIVDELRKNNVEVRPLVCGSMGTQPVYRTRYGVKQLPNCDLINKYGFYVPNHPSISDNDINLICNICNSIIKKG